MSAQAMEIEIMVGPAGSELGSGTAWEAFLDYSQQIGTTDRFR